MSIDMPAHALRCQGLSWEERGALDAIRTETWRRGIPFADDDEAIAHGIGMHLRRWRRIGPKLEPLFDLSNGTWREPELDKARAFAERSNTDIPARFRGKLSAKPLETPAAAQGKEVKRDPQGGDLSMVRDAHPAPAAPPRDAPPRSKVHNGEGRPRSRPRHTSWTRGTAIDPGWDPGDEGRAYARQAGRDDTWIAREARKFSAHHRKKGTICADWAAAWESWVERAPEFELHHHQRGGFDDIRRKLFAGGLASARRRAANPSPWEPARALAG